MKIQTNKFNQRIANSLEKFSKHGGEKVSNYVNAAGKAVIAPFVIIHNPFTHDDKEKREWAAIKQPVEAIITLGLQLLTLGLLYKGINKLIRNKKINFKFLQDAKQDKNKIPAKFLQECNNDKKAAFEKYQEEFNNVFKDRVGAVLSMLTYIPILAISNKIYPKIAQRLIYDKNKPIQQNK